MFTYSLATGEPAAGAGVGGLDLQEYCTKTLDFDAYEDGPAIACHANANLDDACRYEYDNAYDFKMVNATSGLCLLRNGERKGLKSIPGYCRKEHSPFPDQPDPRITAKQVDNVWQCRMPVDASAVCVGQGNDSGLIAARVNELWECHHRAK